MDIKKALSLIQFELASVFQESNLQNIEHMIKTLNDANVVITAGAGRVGLVMSAFAKRLMHLGINAYFFTDTNVPRIKSGDVLFVGSGSGETPSIVLISNIAKNSGADVLLCSANSHSKLVEISNHVLLISSPHKNSDDVQVKSRQPMTTLFEQALYLLLDGLVLCMMKEWEVSEELMKEKHNVLE